MNADTGYLLAQGDARRLPLPNGCVQCVVTSPPYFGLRDYGVAGQIGLEPTPEAFVASMVGVFREVWRVLRDDGICWLNIGDSYNAYNGNRGPSTSFSAATEDAMPSLPSGHGLTAKGLKPKDLIGIPWRVALALQADGWYLRSDIIWDKPNPMCESVTDRPTKGHEYVFLLAKSERYFYDINAVRQPLAPASRGRYAYEFGGAKNIALAEADKDGIGRRTSTIGRREPTEGGNLRTVWRISTQPYKGAHFATYPEELPRRCILAGTSEAGCCPTCRTPWVREVESERVPTRPGVSSKVYVTLPVHPDSPVMRHAGDVCGNRDPMRHVSRKVTKGWAQACGCPAADPVPCLVLDPFNGSGTTGAVARQLDRRYVGFDLSRDYLGLAVTRIADAMKPKSRLDPIPAFTPAPGQLSLFPAEEMY